MTQLLELLGRPAIAWTDVLDIALVSFLIYELLQLIRGTRAAQMALSGGFLLALYFVSRWLDLETVNWIIRNLATYMVFAIIVLFQADIRRAMAHFGRAPFVRYFGHDPHADELIEELVVATSALAARRIGAIIVLERGRIVEVGRHDELLARPSGAYAALYQMQLLEGRKPERRMVPS